MHKDCLAEVNALLRAAAEKLLREADAAHRDPRLKVHEPVLRQQANGLGYATGYLRDAVKP